jgi:hypothetical protein
MSTQQPEALRLADELTTPHMEVNREAAAELRRLHSVNSDLLEALQSIMQMTGGYVPDTSKGEWAKARAAIAKATGEHHEHGRTT